MSSTLRRIISISAGIGAFLVAAVLIGFWADYFARKTTPDLFPQLSEITFSLPSTQGRPISNDDLLGQPVAMFFGFTHCPEVCPVTLYSLTEITASIGEAADELQIVFVTVDPERDTIPVLKSYIEAMNESAIGLSGTIDQHAEMQKAFRVFAQKVPLDDGDYTMDHTATVYLYDAKGRLSGTIAWGEPHDFALAKVKAVLGIKS
jgi:protein SCO1/2